MSAQLPADNSARIERFRPVVEAYFKDGQLTGGAQIVHRRSRGRGVLLRAVAEDGKKVVIKAWAHQALRDRLKDFAGLSNARREWRMHWHLYAAGLPMPEPIGYGRWSDGARRYEMTVTEDLGKLVRSMVCLKRSIRHGDETEARRIEDTIIAMTVKLIEARVSDIDHQLNNVVMTTDGRLVRLDVECAVRWRFRRMPDSDIGAMLGRMVSSHAFACQPDLARTECFARRLAEAVSASPAVLHQAKSQIDTAMAVQKERSGIDSRVSLGW